MLVKNTKYESSNGQPEFVCFHAYKGAEHNTTLLADGKSAGLCASCLKQKKALDKAGVKFTSEEVVLELNATKAAA